MYKELSKHYSRTSDATHYDNFRREGRWLYFKGKDKPLTNEDGKLKTFGKLRSILGKKRIRDLGFDKPKGPTVQQAVALNKAKEELPSMSDITKADSRAPRDYGKCIKKHGESQSTTRGRGFAHVPAFRVG